MRRGVTDYATARVGRDEIRCTLCLEKKPIPTTSRRSSRTPLPSESRSGVFFALGRGTVSFPAA